MAWPTTPISTTGMDQDTDTLPRADIKLMADAVNAIMAARAAADGIASLGSDGKIPSGQLPVVSSIPVGAVMEWYDDNLPSGGWIWANGSAVSRTTYATLFALWGTKFGAGDGSTTFNVIDKRGRMSLGQDDMGGAAAANRVTVGVSGINAATLGSVGGSEALHQHGHTASQGSHAHSGSVSNAGAHTHTESGIIGAIGTGFFFGIDAAINTGTTGPAGDHGHVVTVNAASAGAISIANAGSGASQNMPPCIVCNFIIKT